MTQPPSTHFIGFFFHTTALQKRLFECIFHHLYFCTYQHETGLWMMLPEHKQKENW